jgi:hypothetical protein
VGKDRTNGELAQIGGTMESLRGDESTCIWCGEEIDPDSQGAVVIDEDERCYTEWPEHYYDPKTRVIPRGYGHTMCYLDSIRRAKGLPVGDE